MFINFFYLLKEYEIPVYTQYLIDFYNGMKNGLVNNVEDLFLFSRLSFVKKVEHMDAFQRAFALYFFDIDIPNVKEGDYGLFNTEQFQKWLREAVKKGQVPKKYWELNRDDLMKKFWETLKEQLEEHHGGSKWIGTGGNSPFGHSGNSENGVRVYGESINKSAKKIIGDRRYIEYSYSNTLQDSNINQALESLKNLKKSGAYSELDIPETIYKTANNGGEIELVFNKETKDKIEVILLIDNGGSSMLPHVNLTFQMFSKIKNRFKELSTYFFHNTIFAEVYTDFRRYDDYSTEKLLQQNPDSRVIIIGDASMAPEELVYSYGNIMYGQEHSEPSINWLKKINQKFKYTVWLNPIPEKEWEHTYGSWTLNTIKEVIHMEEMTLSGIKKTVEYLNSR